jgi:hypothetical protein
VVFIPLTLLVEKYDSLCVDLLAWTFVDLGNTFESPLKDLPSLLGWQIIIGTAILLFVHRHNVPVYK